MLDEETLNQYKLITLADNLARSGAQLEALEDWPAAAKVYRIAARWAEKAEYHKSQYLYDWQANYCEARHAA